MPFSSKRVITIFTVILFIAAGGFVYTVWFSSKDIKNVILISIDTCRADFLSCYGYGRPTTPNIDELAAKGILFEHAVSPQPITLPAHCSMLTGVIPPTHGVLDNYDYILSDVHVTLAEVLKAHGFATAGFISSFVLDSQFGLDQGFDDYDDNFDQARSTMGIVERTGDETTAHAIQWLKEERGDKNFIFLHYYDPHLEYAAPEPYGSHYTDTRPAPPTSPEQNKEAVNAYAGEVAFVDHCIGRFTEALKETDLYQSSLIIITSDHGESLGDHKEMAHGYFIYQSTVQVPFIIKPPKAAKSVRVSVAAGLIDIYPTVCSLLGIQMPESIQGNDLSSYWNEGNERDPDRCYFTQSLEPTVYGGNSLLGVVNDRYKYIQTTRPELYDLVADPHETTDLVATQDKRARIMKDQLAEILGSSVRTQDAADTQKELDQSSRNRLESLGYVGGTVHADFSFDQSREDPKDLIAFHLSTSSILSYVRNEEFDKARQLCQAWIAKTPDSHKPYYYLAKILIAEENYEEAIAVNEKILELKPDYMGAYIMMAKCYRSLDNLDKAAETCLKILDLNPDNAEIILDLGLEDTLFEQGRFDVFETMLTDDLTANQLYRVKFTHIADRLLENQQIQLAYRYYRVSNTLEPDVEYILNTLAWLETASNVKGVRNPSEGLKHAQRLCELADNRAEYLDTLAVAYAANGDFQAAASTAQKAAALASQDGNKALAQRITNRLQLYQAGKMFFDPQF